MPRKIEREDHNLNTSQRELPKVAVQDRTAIKIYGLPLHDGQRFDKCGLMEVFQRHKRELTRGNPERRKPEYQHLVLEKKRVYCQEHNLSMSARAVREQAFYPDDLKLFLPIAYTTKHMPHSDGTEDLVVKVLLNTAHPAFFVREDGKKILFDLGEINILIFERVEMMANDVRTHLKRARDEALLRGEEPDYYGYKLDASKT